MKRFLLDRIEEYKFYISQNIPILKDDGEVERIINFNFN